MTQKISAFTLIRNGTRFDYPYLESMRSILPLVDEFIINVGKGEDNTLEQIKNFVQHEGAGKIFWFESDWGLQSLKKDQGGKTLSKQTNLALKHCTGDWCFYLQADEVVHEEDFPALKKILAQCHQHKEVEGLLFDYLHFYGSFDVIQQSRSSYRREVRMLRRAANAQSIGDAQSFRKPDGRKLTVIRSGCKIFHYGWVRSPQTMRDKVFFMDQLYHGPPTAEQIREKTPHTGDNFRYKKFWGLCRFQGTHPQVMASRIKAKGWSWDFENSPWVWKWSDLQKIFLDLFEKLTGYRLFEYQSYRLMNRPLS